MLDAMLTGLCEAAPLGERKMFEFRRVASDMWLKNGDNVSRCITGTGAISGGVKTSKLKVRGGRGAVVQARWTTSLDLLQACFCTLISLPVCSLICSHPTHAYVSCLCLAQDVQRSVTRTIKNNFRDDRKQAAIDLLLGKYREGESIIPARHQSPALFQSPVLTAFLSDTTCSIP